MDLDEIKELRELMDPAELVAYITAVADEQFGTAKSILEGANPDFRGLCWTFPSKSTRQPRLTQRDPL